MCSMPARTALNTAQSPPPSRSPAGRQGGTVGIRTWLLLLLAAALLPFFLVQAGVYYVLCLSQRKAGMEANLERAQAVSTEFGAFVADVLHQQATAGSALVLYDQEPEQAEGLLAQAVRNTPCLRHLCFVSPEGRVLASSEPGLTESHLPALPAATQSSHGHEWALSNLFTDPLSGQPGFAVLQNVRDSRGALAGVVVAVVDPPKLDEALPISLAGTGTGTVALIDGAGRYVYVHPWGNVRPGDSAAQPAALLANALASQGQVATYRSAPGEQEWLAGLAPVPSSGWLAEARRPAAAALAPLSTGLLHGTSLFALAGLAALAAVSVFARPLVDPILNLREQALGLGGGQRSGRVAVAGPAEVRDLVAAFDHMAREIDAREVQSALLLRELQDASRLLEQSEARYRSLFETALDAVLIAGDDGRILEVNPRAGELTGYSQQELLGMSLLNLIPAELHTRAAELYEEYLCAQRIEAELALQHKGGQVLPVEVQAVQVPPIGLQVTLRDIGARTRAAKERERLLAEVHRRAAELDAIITSIPAGIVIIDSSGAVMRMNAAAQALLGHAAGEPSRPWPEQMATGLIQQPDGRPFAVEDLPSFRALHGETVQGAVAVIRRAEAELWLMISAAPISTANGRLLGAVVSYVDATAMHEMQKQREDILGMVSHDLRGPLTVIHGQAELLLRWLSRAGLTGNERRSTVAILASARRMNAMIQDLVDAARLESGQLPMEVRPLDLCSFVVDHMQQMAGMAESERIEVIGAEGLPPVLADAERLARILANLLSNALKYSPPESRVTVSFSCEGGFVVTAVTDHGQGIAPEEIQHLGRRYYRTRSARSHREGLGLGLYICRMLVEALGGRLWVQSEQDQGSTFYFSLPVAE